MCMESLSSTKTNGSADTTNATGNTDVETQYTDVETQNFASLLRIIRQEHYLLNQSRNIHLISQPKKWDFLYYSVVVNR